jgi:hypothetical protein
MRNPSGFARFHWLARLGAGNRRETKRQAVEIAAGEMSGSALIFDRAEKFGHRALETVREPSAFERWCGPACCRVHFDRLL